MLTLSTKHPIRYTPDHLKDEENAPVFLLKVPTLRDAIALDAAIAEEGVRYPSNTEFAAALREAVAAHVVDADRPALDEVLDAFEAASEEGERASAELLAQVEEIARVLRPHHRPLAMIDAERGRFLAMAMLVRAELFLIGIEGEDAPKIERRGGRLTPACQEAIEERYGRSVMFSLGARTVDLSSPNEAERKNSASPPPSPPGPAISTAESEPSTVRRGKSSANAMSETHGSA